MGLAYTREFMFLETTSLDWKLCSSPLQLIILSFLAPESPWWLVRHGKLKEAERSIRRLGGKTMQQEHRAQEQVANMVRTTELEKELAETDGQGKWIDLFKRLVWSPTGKMLQPPADTAKYRLEAN